MILIKIILFWFEYKNMCINNNIFYYIGTYNSQKIIKTQLYSFAILWLSSVTINRAIVT